MSLQRFLNKNSEEIKASKSESLVSEFENKIRDKNTSYFVNPYFSPIKALTLGVALGFSVYLITDEKG